ncbi:MAG: prepilin-type N-terminal cleavage/methylation domain-containing protein [Myxococcales bacterium]|nr:prepilin-type N-terminal cleavage/methylation domain-containing protein [Myxococcales bacterium]
MHRTRSQGFTLIEMMIVVAILGILASIAIPAFVKYIRRAKTTEAVMNLRKLFDSSVTYYEREIADRNGRPHPHQFPGANQALGPAPGNNPCCGLPGDKCPPASVGGVIPANVWQAPHWQALNFSIDDPHYYWYQYVSTGVGTQARFTARSMGNLNCNLTYSTFERVGGVNPASGGVVGGSGIFSVRPLE